MSKSPLNLQLQKVITRFVMDRPGIAPYAILTDDPTINSIMGWISDMTAVDAAQIQTGLTANGDIIVYGLKLCRNKRIGCGLIVIGYSGHLTPK